MKHEELADLYLSYARRPEALEQLYKALALSDRKPAIQTKIIETLVAEQNFEKALKTGRTLLQENPKSIPVRLFMAKIYFQLGYLVEATQNWEVVLSLDPRNSEALHWLNKSQTYKVSLTSHPTINS